jgi:hypothetical protein
VGRVHPEVRQELQRCRRARQRRRPAKKLAAIAQALSGGAIDDTVRPWLLPGPDEEGEDDEPEDGDDDPDTCEVSLLDDDSDDGRDPPPLWLGVLPENWIVVEVFGRCQIGVAVGMGGALWQGISAREARAAIGMSRVPAKDWVRVLDGVQLMGRITAEIRNEQAREEQERQKNRKG